MSLEGEKINTEQFPEEYKCVNQKREGGLNSQQEDRQRS